MRQLRSGETYRLSPKVSPFFLESSTKDLELYLVDGGLTLVSCVKSYFWPQPKPAFLLDSWLSKVQKALGHLQQEKVLLRVDIGESFRFRELVGKFRRRVVGRMFADGISVNGGDFAHVGLGKVWFNNFISLQNKSKFLFITQFACFMIHKSIELLSNRQNNKGSLWNLTQLMGPNVVATPEKAINQKMFPISQNRLIKTPYLSAKKQIFQRPTTKSTTRINFQHYRIKSSLKPKGQFMTSKDTFILQRHNSQPILKSSFKNTIKPLKFNKQGSQEIFGFERTFKSQQLMAGSTVIKKKKIPQFDQSPVESDTDNYVNYLAKSMQIRKPIQQKLRQSQLSQQTSPKSHNKRTFLRKGSSLQKQIVVNLLKNKMMKQHEFDVEKQYTMGDIVQMIKLYKGVHNDQSKNPQLVFSDRKNESKSSQLFNRIKKKNDNPCPINVIKNFQRSIQGWEIQQQLEPEFIKKDDDIRSNPLFIDVGSQENTKQCTN